MWRHSNVSAIIRGMVMVTKCRTILQVTFHLRILRPLLTQPAAFRTWLPACAYGASKPKRALVSVPHRKAFRVEHSLDEVQFPIPRCSLVFVQKQTISCRLNVVDFLSHEGRERNACIQKVLVLDLNLTHVLQLRERCAHRRAQDDERLAVVHHLQALPLRDFVRKMPATLLLDGTTMHEARQRREST